MKKVYEIVLIGFNGGTDETDDNILWVVSDSKESVAEFLNKLKMKFVSIEETDLDINAFGIDIHLIDKQ